VIGKWDSAWVTADLDGAVKDRSVKSSNNFGRLNGGKQAEDLKLGCIWR
jgi:hypothetical protein